MKKLICTSIVPCIIAFVMTINAFATPTILWDFGVDTNIENYMGKNSAASDVIYDAESYYYIFTATGNDPNVSIDMSADDVSQILWVAARVLNKSYATAIELFGHTNGRDLNGSECTHIDLLPNSDRWQTVITYIPDANVSTVNAYKAVDPITETYWEGTVDWIRLDPMWSEGDDGSDSGGNMTDGQQICIDYIAFFPTKDEATAYIEAEKQNESDETGALALSDGNEAIACFEEAQIANENAKRQSLVGPAIIYWSVVAAAGILVSVLVLTVNRKKKKSV